jgi:predicted GNAT family N-acyltransferase
MSWEVNPVEVGVVRPLRHAVLRPGAPWSDSFYPADDLDDTLHLAVRDGEVVIGVATVFPEAYDGHPAWRLRGMAVVEGRRGEGVGSRLLAEVLSQVRSRGADLLWCNARTVALSFYSTHGFTIVGEEFLAAHGVPHYLAMLPLNDVVG